MRIGCAWPSSALLGAAEPVDVGDFRFSRGVPLGGRRAGVKMGRLPADADVSLTVGGRDSVWRRGRAGGSRTVATSTPVRVSVPNRAPRATPTHPGGCKEAVVCGQTP